MSTPHRSHTLTDPNARAQQTCTRCRHTTPSTGRVPAVLVLPCRGGDSPKV